MSSSITIYTVGHSTHTFEKFLELFERNGVTAIVDVRSNPFSRHNPQFNKDTLSAELKKHGIAYVFLGKELGARSDDPSCYEGGKVSYSRLTQTPIFKAGIERVLNGARKYRIALMCAEKEPLDCHRTFLVSRELDKRGVSIVHILSDGSTETQSQTMRRLVGSQLDMFRIYDEQVELACKEREQKIAYVDETLAKEESQ